MRRELDWNAVLGFTFTYPIILIMCIYAGLELIICGFIPIINAWRFHTLCGTDKDRKRKSREFLDKYLSKRKCRTQSH